MSANQARFRVATMARVLGVSPSGYYAWRRRPPSARARADAELRARVQAIHGRSRGTYGAPRIHAELTEGGVAVSRKRVARVMRSVGVAGVSRRRGPRTTRRNAQARPPRIGSSGASRRTRRTGSGSPTSPTSRPWPASCTWPSSSTCSAGASSVGPWRGIFAPRWWSRRWRWPWTNGGRSRSSITPIKVASTPRWPSALAAANGASRCRWVRSAIASTVNMIVVLSGRV